MKILQINNFHYIFSGTERYYFELARLFKSKGHKVAFFSMLDQRNRKTVWSKYFLEHMSLRKIDPMAIPKILGRIIYSLESKRKISKLLDDFKPDIAHIHTIDLFISPSIISEIKKRGIPIVYTLHNYQLIAPTSGSLFHNGKICEITKTHNYYKAIFHKCIRNSYTASGAYVIKQYIHHILGFYNHIDIFIAPSKFIRNKFIEYGFNPKKIIHIPNFTYFQRKTTNSYGEGKYILYFGRLSQEKGLDTLFETMCNLPKIKLKIVGSGPLLHKLLHKKNIYKLNNVDFISYKREHELKSIIRKSRFSILPSIWYDVFPMAILESFACGKTVIGSNIGGIPELVQNNKTGLLFEPGNLIDLAKKILFLWNNVQLCEKLGKTSLMYLKTNFSKDQHFNEINNIYNLILKEKLKSK